MSYTVSDISLEDLYSYWRDPAQSLVWPYPFILPHWLEAWWTSFGEGKEPYLKKIIDGDDIIGIAPLMISDGAVGFLGSTDVCDYQDFIIRPGYETDFCAEICAAIKGNGYSLLELKHVRPDSHVMNALREYAGEQHFPFSSVEEDTSVGLTLPEDFEGYLNFLSTKQRHEVRRKLRRLNESGTVTYRVLDDKPGIQQALDGFFSMFVESRNDKALFLTPVMKTFFLNLMEKLGEAGILRLGVLELDGLQVADIIFFDYGDCRYLYNCGYKPEYTGLSVGLVSKIKTIEDAIERKIRVFDFLKGNETYKYHLGGRDMPLSRCRVELT